MSENSSSNQIQEVDDSNSKEIIEESSKNLQDNLEKNNNNNSDEDQIQDNGKINLEDVFYAYCNIRTAAFQPITSTLYNRILLSQADAWMDKAKLIGRSNTTFTLTETGYEFFKFRKWRISFDEFNEYLQNLCNLKNIDVNELKAKLLAVGAQKHG